MRKIIYLLISAVLFDLVITLSFWALESNPIVLATGKEIFILSHVLVLAIPILWKNVKDSWTEIIGKAVIFMATFLYLAAGITNLWVIL